MGKAKTKKRTVPAYYTGNDEKVGAYTRAGIESIRHLLDRAQIMANGYQGKDEGSCVVDAGIFVWYVRPRSRVARPARVVAQPFQGNLATQRACEEPLKWLKESGVDAFYRDGSMN